MFALSPKRYPVNRHLLKKCLKKYYSTSVEPVRKDPSDEYYGKELKRFETLKNITKREREKKPQRDPFVKNLLLGVFDKEILTFPEIDLSEVKNAEKDAEGLSKLLKQRHMVNTDSLGNKLFRQNLADHRAIGLQASQFLDGRESTPMEVMKFLETLSEHKLRDNLIFNEMLGVQALNRFANELVQRKYLYPVIKGEQLSAFAMHENKLYDINEMKTKAVLSNDKKHWTLNGQKSFVVNGISADFLIVFAVTESVKLDKDTVNHIGVFVVEKDTSGVSWKKQEPANIEIAELSFDNVQVPAENVIHPDEGIEILKELFTDFRLSCGPPCISISKNMINNLYNTLIEYSTPEFEWVATDAVRGRLGELAMDLYAAESVTYLTAGLQEWYEEQDIEIESAIVKVFTSEVAHRISTACIDLVGLPATLNDHWASQGHQESLNYLTLHESNESQRLFIAANCLKHAGIYLASKIKKLRNPLFHGTYNILRLFTERRQDADNPKLEFELYGHLHPSCTESSRQLEYCVKRLEYITELVLNRHGVEVTSRHVELRRLADIIVDCYVMTAVLARASRAYCIGLQFSDYEVILASTFCNLATERVRDNVKNILYTEHKNNERNHIHAGKRLVDSKGYFLTHAMHRFF